MVISEDDVRFCIDKANEIAEQYKLLHLNGNACLRETEGLLWICATYLGRRVDVHDFNKLSAEGREILGMYVDYPNETDIFLFKGMEPLERRMVLGKELFHVVLNDEASRSTELFSHLDDYLSSSTVEGMKASRPVAWERLAYAAAMEFFFPYADRLKIAETGGTLNTSFENIGVRYGIPPSQAENFCSDRSMAYFGKFHRG